MVKLAMLSPRSKGRQSADNIKATWTNLDQVLTDQWTTTAAEGEEESERVECIVRLQRQEIMTTSQLKSRDCSKSEGGLGIGLKVRPQT